MRENHPPARRIPAARGPAADAAPVHSALDRTNQARAPPMVRSAQAARRRAELAGSASRPVPQLLLRHLPLVRSFGPQPLFHLVERLANRLRLAGGGRFELPLARRRLRIG